MTTRMKMTISMAVNESLEMTVAAGTSDVDLLRLSMLRRGREGRDSQERGRRIR